MNTATASINLGRRGYFAQRDWQDWVFALLIIGGAGFAFSRYGNSMDGYEKGILACSVPALIALGWALWRSYPSTRSADASTDTSPTTVVWMPSKVPRSPMTTLTA